jgi:glutamate---cysteine ligase / carboxylate-amine ligase
VSVRKIGVEEELQLVDPETGEPRPVSGQAMAADDDDRAGGGDEERDGDIQQELFLQQLEAATPPCHELTELERALRAGRRRVVHAAEQAGADAIAVPTPVLAGDIAHVTPKPRYQRIVHEFGTISSEAGVAGMHVHIDVHDDDEAIAVLDRIRPWLPVVLAISANSPYWLGNDTGYASWRAQVWSRWPTAGQFEPYVDAAGYRAATQAVMGSGAAIDRGMLYLDARPAAELPTLEVRIADVCTEVEDVCLVAGVVRALVETAARAAADGEPVPPWRTDLLRAAQWKASRDGLSHSLVHPVHQRPVPAREAVEALIAHAQEALTDAGDLTRVNDAFEQLLARGSGAARQRAVAEAGGDLRAVVRDLTERTRASCDEPRPD